MDAHSVVQIFFCYAFQNGYSKSLRHFAGMWAEEMNTDYTIMISLIDNDFGIAVVFKSVVIEVPLERLINTAISYNIASTELFACIFLAVANTAILNWGEYCGWNIAIAHEARTIIEQTCS